MNRNRFIFPIPFDPFRLLLAGIEHAKLWLLAGIVLGILGVVAGVVILGDSYTAPVQLAKESAPLSWSVDANGPYRPRPLSSEALELIAQSPLVYERAGRLAGGYSLEDVEALVTFTAGAGEDLYGVTGYSKASDEASLELSRAYAQAIIDVAAEKRREEAAAAAAVFRTQLEHRKEALSAVGNALKARSSEQSGILNGEHIGGHFEELKSLRQSLSETRVELRTKKENFDVYLRQTVLTPLEQELALLRANRTDEHPAVRHKRLEIQQLEKQLKNVATGESNLDALSRKVPSSLFSHALRLRDEIKTLETSLNEYERMLHTADAETATLSDQAISIADIRSSFNREVDNSANIESRLKDAEFYASEESGSPVAFFAAPHLANVKVKSRWFKGSILGVAGLIIGASFALGLIFFRELLCRNVRTPMQAAIAAATLPKFTFPGGKRSAGNLHDFAVTCVLKFLPERRFLFPVIGDVDGERAFWEQLLEAFGHGRSRQRVVFADVSNAPLNLNPKGMSLADYDPNAREQDISRIDISKLSGDRFANFARSLPVDTVLLVRWDTDPDATLAALAPHIERYYLMSSQVSTQIADLEELSRVYEQVLGPAEGLVLVQEQRPGFASRFVASIERWFIQLQVQRLAAPSPVSALPVSSQALAENSQSFSKA